jgi:hypothetical protein
MVSCCVKRRLTTQSTENLETTGICFYCETQKRLEKSGMSPKGIFVKNIEILFLPMRFLGAGMLESEPYTGGQPYTMVRILQQGRSAQHQCTRTKIKSGLRIRIHFIRIQHFRQNTDPDSDPIRIQGFDDQKWEKITAEKNFLYLFSFNLHIPRPP